MTNKELKVLENKLNECVDEYDFITAFSSDPEWICTAIGKYNATIAIIRDLNIHYHKEYVERTRESIEYTTIHYTLYTD